MRKPGRPKSPSISNRNLFLAFYVQNIAKWIKENIPLRNRPKHLKPTEAAQEIVELYTGECLETIRKAYKDRGKLTSPVPYDPNIDPFLEKAKKSPSYEWLNNTK